MLSIQFTSNCCTEMLLLNSKYLRTRLRGDLVEGHSSWRRVTLHIETALNLPHIHSTLLADTVELTLPRLSLDSPSCPASRCNQPSVTLRYVSYVSSSSSSSLLHKISTHSTIQKRNKCNRNRPKANSLYEGLSLALGNSSADKKYRQ